MTDEKKTDTETAGVRRRFGRRKLISAAAVVATIIWVLALRAGWWDSGSIDEQFAAIDAELAIPDSENAAVYYRRFFADPDNTAILRDLSNHARRSAYCEPWSDEEYPELAEKLEKHRVFIQTFLDISEMPKARFPVHHEPDTDWHRMLFYMSGVARILSWAAGNDLAEGRGDAALRKYQCQMQVARKYQEQPTNMYDRLGISFEGLALENIMPAVMRQETTPEQLRSLEKILEVPVDRIERHDEIRDRVDRLIEKRERSRLSMTGKLKRLLNGWKRRREFEQIIRLLRLHVESIRNATSILIALRRHKGKTGTWPETLEEIEPKLPSQILTDPQNESSFVYKLEGDSFVFYSKGPNNIDENGSSKEPADDWPIWPMKTGKGPAASGEDRQE